MRDKNQCLSMLCPFSLGVALGVAKGLCLMLFAWAGHFWGFGLPMVHHLATVYHGYAPTVMGGIYGGLWGLLGGFVFGMVIGFIYDFCVCCCAKRSCCAKKSCCDEPKEMR